LLVNPAKKYINILTLENIVYYVTRVLLLTRFISYLIKPENKSYIKVISTTKAGT